MKNTSFTITCDYMGESLEVTIDGSTNTKEDVLNSLQDQVSTPKEDEDLSEEFTVTDWQDVPEWLQEEDFSLLAEVMPELEKSHYEIEVFEAAHEADIQFSDIDEAYNGEFSSDEDFAQNMAEEIGALDKKATWPQTCIDWGHAARELMFDYSEANGHYFRNL